MATGSAAVPLNVNNSTGREENYTMALTVLTSLFFMWGFITVLNDILIPHLKMMFDLNYTQVMLIQFTFFTAYAIISLPSGIIVEKIGYKWGIVIGLLVAGIGCVLFYPAAGLRSYPIFLSALFVLASGITLLQVAANPYVAILGKPEYASSRLNLTQAFNSLGTMIGPMFGSFLILGVAAHSAEEASSVQYPYLWIAATLVVIAAIIALVKLPIIEAKAEESASGSSSDTLHKSAWGYRHLVLGAVAIFVYVGGEVAIGSFLVNFIGQPEIAGLPASQAGYYLSFYWGGAMVGRFLGAAVLRKLSPSKVLAFNALVAAVLVVLGMVFSGYIAMWALLAIGLFNSIMFPTIFTLAISGLGKHTGQGSGILCVAIVGGAIVPVLQGYFADQIGIHHAFFLPVLCYLFIVYYGLKGYAPRFEKA